MSDTLNGLEEDSPLQEKFRAECYCGWKGSDQDQALQAIRQAQEHQRQTGHYLDPQDEIPHST